MHASFTIVALLISFATLNQAHAFQCRYYSDRTEIEIRDMEDTKMTLACPDGLESHSDKPLVVYFTSNGGDIDHIRGVVNDLRTFLLRAQMRSGLTPTVVFREECSSACIPILSGLNQMARENFLRLLVDRKTLLGFHGCSDVYLNEPKLRFSIPGTRRYLGYLREFGASTGWIEANQELFKSPEITEILPEDRRLQDSGLLTYAEIVDLNSHRITFQNSPINRKTASR